MDECIRINLSFASIVMMDINSSVGDRSSLMYFNMSNGRLYMNSKIYCPVIRCISFLVKIKAIDSFRRKQKNKEHCKKRVFLFLYTLILPIAVIFLIHYVNSHV